MARSLSLVLLIALLGCGARSGLRTSKDAGVDGGERDVRLPDVIPLEDVAIDREPGDTFVPPGGILCTPDTRMLFGEPARMTRPVLAIARGDALAGYVVQPAVEEQRTFRMESRGPGLLSEPQVQAYGPALVALSPTEPGGGFVGVRTDGTSLSAIQLSSEGTMRGLIFELDRVPVRHADIYCADSAVLTAWTTPTESQLAISIADTFRVIPVEGMNPVFGSVSTELGPGNVTMGTTLESSIGLVQTLSASGELLDLRDLSSGLEDVPWLHTTDAPYEFFAFRGSSALQISIDGENTELRPQPIGNVDAIYDPRSGASLTFASVRDEDRESITMLYGAPGVPVQQLQLISQPADESLEFAVAYDAATELTLLIWTRNVGSGSELWASSIRCEATR